MNSPSPLWLLILSNLAVAMVWGCGNTPDTTAPPPSASPEVREVLVPSLSPDSAPSEEHFMPMPSYAYSEDQMPGGNHDMPMGQHEMPAGTAEHTGGPGTMATARFKDHVVPVLKLHCFSCHSPGGAGSQRHVFFDETGEADYQAVKTNVARILLAIENGRMPLGNPQSLTPREFETLKAWFHMGAPND